MTTQKLTPPNTEITPSRHKVFNMPLQGSDYPDEIRDNAGNMVAMISGDDHDPKTEEQRDFTIRAVNSFDDMLSALKAAVADRIDDEWLKNARKIIRKAEKQP